MDSTRGALDDSILYLMALIGDRPRQIDRYIDYFGDSVPRAARRSKPA
jgi:hypothetical protein